MTFAQSNLLYLKSSFPERICYGIWWALSGNAYIRCKWAINMKINVDLIFYISEKWKYLLQQNMGSLALWFSCRCCRCFITKVGNTTNYQAQRAPRTKCFGISQFLQSKFQLGCHLSSRSFFLPWATHFYLFFWSVPKPLILRYPTLLVEMKESSCLLCCFFSLETNRRESFKNWCRFQTSLWAC